MAGMPVPRASAPAPPKRTTADFAKAREEDQHGVQAAQRTAARTGTTYDMGDVLTHGHAYKVPPKQLPSTSAKMAVLHQTEATMPGDVLGPLPESYSAYDRMAKLVRSRNLDLLNLMDDFLKRPRGSRMPVRNRAFLDVSPFRRALCYAFGDQWTGLAITSAEFEAIWKKYERSDVSLSEAEKIDRARALTGAGGSGYQGGGRPGAGMGQPEALILWQAFAQDVQRLADGDRRTDAEKLLLEAELALMAKSEAAEAAAIAAHDADDNKGDAKARLRAKQEAAAAQDAVPIGNRGATIGEVKAAKKVIAETLTGAGGKYDTVREALRDIDNDGNGILQRDEVKLLLNEHYLMKYVDFYTGMTRGVLDEHVIDTLLDLIDKDGNGEIMADEFASEVLAGANTYFFDESGM